MSTQKHTTLTSRHIEQTDQTDLILWEKTQIGDVTAFEMLFEKYYTLLYQFTGRFIRDAQTAENLVQDFFVKIWTERKTLQINTNLKTYFYISLKNNALNFINSQRLPAKYVTFLLNQSGLTENPEDQCINSEMHRTVHQAINKLPEKCRQIYLMKKYDNLSYQEIADIMDISVNTVKTQIKRALKKLQINLSHLITP